LTHQLSGFFVAFLTEADKATQDVDTTSARCYLAGLSDSVFYEPQG